MIPNESILSKQKIPCQETFPLEVMQTLQFEKQYFFILLKIREKNVFPKVQTLSLKSVSRKRINLEKTQHRQSKNVKKHELYV